ncbi:MAG TPA: tRNA (guanosine(37)-N1)-methyltransferase TrmD [Saprospiraceae bacterium]|nr:tRNA (guanosine(37)-N1)-methyltransferase TrmD [Saprospiraceae bacterium]
MRFDIISAVPELLVSPFEHSIIKRATQNGILEINVHDLRVYGLGSQNQIDDYQYGGGAGMVMMCEPLDMLINSLKKQTNYDDIIYLTPDSKNFTQKIANELSLGENLLLICGHYKGIDERIRQLHVTREISIGDFVLSGGEIAAAVLVDSISRLVPGVMNDETSALFDSFQDNLLAPPVYTRPAEYQGLKVPDILLSGHQAKIDEWRYTQALERTQLRRPDLLQDESN